MNSIEKYENNAWIMIDLKLPFLYNDIGVVGMENISIGLAKNSTLETLNIKCNNIGDYGI